MKIISTTIQRSAVMILALTLFLLLSASHAFAQDNSAGSVQNSTDYTFSHKLNAETITFEAVNPSNQAPGRMTVTITGIINGYRLWDGQSVVGSHLKAEQRATFSFVPYYPYSASYSVTGGLWQSAGDTNDDSLISDFAIRTNGSDGSFQRFMLREVLTATENGARITFEQLKLPDSLNTQEELPCGTVLDEHGALLKPDISASARR
jgi:hypothetical protein